MGIKVDSSARLHFQKYALTLEGTSDKAVGAAALAVKKAILAGAPSRLRGVGKRGARLSVRYDVKNGVALVRAVGPWQLIENDTKAHDIFPKKRRARGGKRVAVLTPQGPRASAHSRGTRGKHPWAKGVERGTPAATLAYVKVIQADLRKQFG
jgi:hypothetical protein